MRRQTSERGHGAFKRVLEVFRKLENKGVLFGTSITATSANIEEITSPGFIGAMRESGCGLFFFVEYVPVSDNSRHLVLGEAKKKQLLDIMPVLDLKHKAVFITFPGDESVYGGCSYRPAVSFILTTPVILSLALSRRFPTLT